MPCPDRRTPAQWRQLLSDAEVFHQQWGSTAAALGWMVTDVFGSPADPYVSAVGQLGLVPLLDGRPVAAMTAASATIANPRGAPTVFHLYPWRRPGVPLWIAYAPECGP